MRGGLQHPRLSATGLVVSKQKINLWTRTAMCVCGGGQIIARVRARKTREEVGGTGGAASEPLGFFLLSSHLKSDPLFIPKGAGHFYKALSWHGGFFFFLSFHECYNLSNNLEEQHF